MKTFYAKTMPEALQSIKRELGPEALLLSTKEIPSHSGVNGSASGFEVVAAAEYPEEDHFTCARAVRVPAEDSCERRTYSREAGTEQDTKSDERNRLSDARLELLPRDLVSQTVYDDLVTAGVEEWLARKLVVDAQEEIAPEQRPTRTVVLQGIDKVAQRLIRTIPNQDGLPGRRVVIFLGPTGVGKTTSIAKLAARLALQQRKKIVLLTLDGFRIGAVEQLRSYAGLIGVPFRFVRDVAELPRAIQEQSQRDYILIDTPGRGPKDIACMRELASFLQDSATIERHLVLSATTKSSDLQKTMNRFESCNTDYLIFTKLDETSAPGPILNELVRSRKRLSYYSDGQGVPEDFHTASKDRIVDIVLNAN